MKHLIDQVMEAVFSEHRSESAVLMGDLDFAELSRYANAECMYVDQSKADTTYLMICDTKVYSDNTPGNRGFIIGSPEAIEKMRKALSFRCMDFSPYRGYTLPDKWGEREDIDAFLIP